MHANHYLTLYIERRGGTFETACQMQVRCEEVADGAAAAGAHTVDGITLIITPDGTWEPTDV